MNKKWLMIGIAITTLLTITSLLLFKNNFFSTQLELVSIFQEETSKKTNLHTFNKRSRTHRNKS